MRILSIETSCDETGIAVIEKNPKKRKIKILSNLVFSQIKIHKKWGGVVPGLAKREHQKVLVPLLEKALKQSTLLEKEKKELCAKELNFIENILKKDEILEKKLLKFLTTYKKPNIDYIAVTYGPGLEPALWTGLNLAKTLSYTWKIPLIPINHIEAHIFINFFKKDIEKIDFPALCLIVSGGHTQLVLMKKLFDYKIIGDTRDDAAGECFDKTGRLLKIDYPAGPIISKLAEKGDANFHQFPRPMINFKNFDFSFSGLKTSVLYFLKDKETSYINKNKENICASIQKAIIDVLVFKSLKATKKFKIKTIVLGGGVASNMQLRKELKKNFNKNANNTKIIMSEPKLNTDNGLMIAITAFYKLKYKNFKNIKNLGKIKVVANLKL